MISAPILRDLTQEEAAAAAAFPLPAGVSDAEVNKYQLAEALKTTTTTVDAWIRAGLPVEEAGANGRSYRIRLSLAYAWMAARNAARAAQDEAAEAAAAQLRLAIDGGHTRDARAGLSPKELQELYAAQAAYVARARERRELIYADEVAEFAERVFLAVRDAAIGLPDAVAAECEIDGAALEAISRQADAMLRAVRREIERAAEERPEDGRII